MLRVLFLATAFPLAAGDSAPPPARKVTLETAPPAALAKAIQEQTGYTVDLSALEDRPVRVSVKGVEFWKALEHLAAATASRIAVSQGKIALKPGPPKGPGHVTGPFRFTAREVIARTDLEAGISSYEVGLAVAWEPGVHAYRIDGRPRITKAADDTGRTVGISSGGSRSYTAWNSAPLAVFPTGVGRGARSLTLEGTVTVTLADELLTFAFPAAVKPPAVPAQKGVAVAVVKSAADGNDWVVEVELTYPKGDVVWESHEDYWLRNNVLRLFPPGGGTPIKMELDNILDRSIRYVAKGQGKRVGAGWGLDYRAPGPMREVTVPFVLKDIPLP